VNTDKKPFMPMFKYDYLTGNCSCCNTIRELTHICKCKKALYCSVYCAKADHELHKDICSSNASIEDFDLTENSNSIKGFVGIKNLGNSCYMNTAIQCLSHTFELVGYFLNNAFKQHINKSNPLGYKGDIAYHFAKVVKLLYYGSERNISLLEFKHCISKYHPDVFIYNF
jgi:ubiquitin carboxyl-terminal hydrolase 4/11/15